MGNYESMARKIYAPLMEKYHFEFAAMNEYVFFLIGHGFALKVYVDLRDRCSDAWYVFVDDSGEIKEYSLMYIHNFTPEERAHYGKPQAFDEYIAANMRVVVAWLMNQCHDMLTGDKSWLQGYPGKGHYIRHTVKFLAPYFQTQGYPVVIRE